MTSPGENAVPRRTSRRTLGIVFFTVFLDLLGFGIIIPIQPFYASAFGADPWVVTLLGTTYSLMQFLFSPVWGRLSDRVGRRPVMLVSVASSAVGFTIFGFAESLWMLFLARAISGFGNANLGTAQAIIADSTTAENRARGMGLIGAAFGLGFIAGPALGGLAGVQLGPAAPAFIAAGLAAVNWILALWFLPETHPTRARDASASPGPRELAQGQPGPRFGISLAQLRRISGYEGVFSILLVYFVFSFGFSLMEQTIGLYIGEVWVGRVHGSSPAEVEEQIRQSARLTTYVLLLVGVAATVVQGMLIGRLARVFGERRLLATGTLVVAAGFVGITAAGMSGSYPSMLLAGVVIAFGSGLCSPSMSSLLSRAVNPMEQGAALGLGQSLGALGRVGGPAISGALLQAYSPLPFWVGAALMLGCFAAALMIRERGRASALVRDGAH
jgi:MFS family permease